jgi:hypothetical protein
MKNEFVTYEVALALKELGFDEECFGYYVITTLLITTDNVYDSKEIPVIKAPLKQQVFRWFREKYNYNHSIIFHKHPFGTNDYQYMILLEDDEYVEVNFNTYEEAENACIDKLIEIVKQQDNG